MPKLRSFWSSVGIPCTCMLVSIQFTGCSVFKSKEQKAKERHAELLRQDPETTLDKAPTKTAWNTSGNPKWKKDIDRTLAKGRESVPGYKPSGPVPRNESTDIKVDLSRARETTYHSVPVNGSFISLTFDDGPHPKNTPRLLDMLKERNIKATFFVVGPNARNYPDIMKRIVAEGHEIGNHTMTHGNLAKMSNSQIRAELDGCRQAIISSCGVNPRLMRAPYGALTNSQKLFIKDTWGYPNIHWSVDPEDWKRPGPSVVANRILSNTRSGGIVLVHDIHAPSIVAMPETLDGLLRKGFRFVTTSQLISLGNTGTAGADIGEAPELEAAATGEATDEAIAPAATAVADGVEGEEIPPVPLPSTKDAGGEAQARIEE